MYKAIIIDIDGTLQNSNKKISHKTIRTIKKITKKGILVILCSGRPKEYVEYISKKCHASKYIIASLGGCIYNYLQEKTLYLNIMDKKSCLELYKISQRENVCFIMHTGTKNNVISKEEIHDVEKYISENDIIQCILLDKNFEKIKKIKTEIEQIEGVEIKNQHKSLIDNNEPINGDIYYGVANKYNSKGNAIKILCEMINIDLKDVIGIGNDYNDVSMFEVVGYSVVMANAKDEIKKYADEITKSNDENGVAVFLKKLMKNYKL